MSTSVKNNDFDLDKKYKAEKTKDVKKQQKIIADNEKDEKLKKLKIKFLNMKQK